MEGFRWILPPLGQVGGDHLWTSCRRNLQCLQLSAGAVICVIRGLPFDLLQFLFGLWWMTESEEEFLRLADPSATCHPHHTPTCTPLWPWNQGSNGKVHLEASERVRAVEKAHKTPP